MKLLIITDLNPTMKSIATLAGYYRNAKMFGHHISIYGDRPKYLRSFEYTKNYKEYDYALFVIHNPQDLPGLPSLPRLLDNIPKEKRIVIDCLGHYNKTIRIEHDFNHLEKLDGHQGWEWVDAIKAISDKILQPTPNPLKNDVYPFLFHAFDSDKIDKSYSDPSQAAKSWSTSRRKHGIIYIGNNWQKWEQISNLLKTSDIITDKIGLPLLTGWNWDKLPEWAVKKGIKGADLDRNLLKKLKAQTQQAIPFHKVITLSRRGRICPIIHRPLFNKIEFVTNRTFETFCTDTIPFIMFNPTLAKHVYGPAAGKLIPDNDIISHITNIIENPQPFWQAIIDIRNHLSLHHSFERRFKELETILEN